MGKGKGLIYKAGKKVIKAQKGVQTSVLGGPSGIVNEDYSQNQYKPKVGSNTVGSNVGRSNMFIAAKDRSATTREPAQGQRINTNNNMHPNQSPIDVVGGGAPSQATVKARQLNLLKAGRYSGKIDGIWGPKSSAAWEEHMTANPGLAKFFGRK